MTGLIRSSMRYLRAGLKSNEISLNLKSMNHAVSSPNWCSLRHTESWRGFSSSPTENLHTIKAFLREDAGSLISYKLRKQSLTPGLLFSAGPEPNKRLIQLVEKDILRELRKHGGRLYIQCQPYNLEIYETETSETPIEVARVLPKQVHMTASTDKLENINFIRCPLDAKKMKVKVYIKIIGCDTSPGIKRGGYCNLIHRHIPCICPGDKIPQPFEIDVSKMEAGDKVMVTDLKFPDGVTYNLKDPAQPVVMISGKMRTVR